MVQDADRAVLRGLAERVRQIAETPQMAERRELWRRHNRLDPVRPMLLVFPEGSWGELLPGSALVCQDEAARRIEWELRHRIYMYEHFRTDNVVNADWTVSKAIHNSGWGVATKHRAATVDRGAWGFDPVIHEHRDLEQIQMPQISHDEEASARRLAEAQELFGDLLDVRLVGISHVSFHFMNVYTGWRGLEQVMLDMYTEPDMVHDAMARLEAGYRGMVEQYRALNLFDLNHDNTYHSSGGNGYLAEPPNADRLDPQQVEPHNLWSSAESQEMSEVSPEFHREFVMEYERRVLEPFALNGYGCCEGLHRKLDDVFEAIPNVRRISMSPFADIEVAAPRMGRRAIFSWKPQPSYLVGRFDEELIREDLRHGLEVCRDNVLEIILKDTHTCQQQPERFDRWTAIARELVGE
ncbi:MAG: hypothetical protein IT204_04690 [Fimbriimonadaceae bacterium]|nr:hypothetical protein [Fimbriimonadaceae bacterium]